MQKTTKTLQKGFTIIELIVVIAVIGVLVLLALPKFLGYTEKAKIAQVKSEIVAKEKFIDSKRVQNDDYIKDWEKVDVATMESLKKSLFNKKGLITDSNNVEFKGEYYNVPKNSELEKMSLKMKTSSVTARSLKGDFYLGQGGEVYYYDENLANKVENETPTAKPENLTDEDLGYSKADFTWVEDIHGYSGLNREKGYFKYTGAGRSVVKIPHVIQGVPITSYYYMFYNSPAEVTKVISTNKNVTSMCLMFNSSKAESITFGPNFNTSNVNNMKSMFSWVTLSTLDLSTFDTSNVTDMSRMFGYASTKIGYARTQADADKLNASIGKPTGLTFVVKKP